MSITGCYLCDSDSSNPLVGSKYVCKECLKRYEELGICEAERITRNDISPQDSLTGEHVTSITKDSVKIKVRDARFAYKHPEHFCTRCGRCCQKFKEIFMKDANTKERIDAWGENVFHQVTERKNGHLMMVDTEPCYFFDNSEEKCSAYEDRPLGCKQFPIWVEKESIGLQNKNFCNFLDNLFKKKVAANLISYHAIKEKRTNSANLTSILKKSLSKKFREDKKKIYLLISLSDNLKKRLLKEALNSLVVE